MSAYGVQSGPESWVIAVGLDDATAGAMRRGEPAKIRLKELNIPSPRDRYVVITYDTQEARDIVASRRVSPDIAAFHVLNDAQLDFVLGGGQVRVPRNHDKFELIIMKAADRQEAKRELKRAGIRHWYPPRPRNGR